MVTLARIALRLIEDILSGVVLLLRSTVAVRAENLFLLLVSSRSTSSAACGRGVSMPPAASAWRC